MKWREHLQIFVLTKQEQRTIAFIVLMVVLGLATKHYRAQHPRVLVPNEMGRPSATPRASPSSG